MSYKTDLYYGPWAPDHAFDLANPYEEVRRYLLICIRGGGWTGGSKEADNFDGGADIPRLSNDEGIAVACINYQHASLGNPTAPTPTSPNVLDNIKVAIENIKARVNPDRTILLGTSAGANLGMCAHLRWPELADGFIGCYGPYDIDPAYSFDFSNEVNNRIAIFTNDEAERIQAASPARSPNDRPPSLFIHDTADKVVRVNQTYLMEGPDDVILHAEGEGHGFRPLVEPYLSPIIDYIKQTNEWDKG